jgi:hypothetical protein
VGTRAQSEKDRPYRVRFVATQFPPHLSCKDLTDTGLNPFETEWIGPSMQLRMLLLGGSMPTDVLEASVLPVTSSTTHAVGGGGGHWVPSMVAAAAAAAAADPATEARGALDALTLQPHDAGLGLGLGAVLEEEEAAAAAAEAEVWPARDAMAALATAAATHLPQLAVLEVCKLQLTRTRQGSCMRAKKSDIETEQSEPKQ